MITTVQGSELDLAFDTTEGKRTATRKTAIIRVEQKDVKTTIIGLSDGTEYEVPEPVDAVLATLHEGQHGPSARGGPGRGRRERAAFAERPDRRPRQGNLSKRSTRSNILSNPSRLERLRRVRDEKLAEVQTQREEPQPEERETVRRGRS
jgi:hypothetical protein